MIMPLDIQNKEFSKGVRGYKEEEVDRFLDLITVDYENLIQETKLLKERIAGLEKELEKKEGLENSIKETVDATRKLMREAEASAEKRAEIVLKNAEMEAQIIIKNAEAEAQQCKNEVLLIQKRISIFNERFKNLLGGEMERFEESVKDADALLQE